MVELAFSTNAYTRHSLPEAVRRIADHGYAGVELLGDDPHAYFPNFEDADRDALLEALSNTDLAVSNINANTAMGYYDDAPPSAFFEPSVIRADDEAREWRIEYTKRAIDLAETVGSPAVCLATGRPLPGTTPGEARDYLRESLHEILDYAEARDIEVGIEFEPELLIENTDEVLEVIDEVAGTRWASTSMSATRPSTARTWPKASAPAPAPSRASTSRDIVGGRRGKHYHRIPGEGNLDFQAIFDALEDIGYDGFATLELYTYPDEPDRAAREAFEALEEYVYSSH